jgi:hypothetical protein
LNQRGLPAERARLFKDVMMKFDNIMAQRYEIGAEEAAKRLQELRQQVHEFAAVVRAAYQHSVTEYKRLLEAAA